VKFKAIISALGGKKSAARIKLGAAVLLCASTAFAASARLYDLKNGTVTPLKYSRGWGSGHGKINGVLPSGQQISGEYNTTDNSKTAWGSIYAAGSSAFGSLGTIPGSQHGTAVMVGDGDSLQCEYVVNAWSGHGSGFCKDNQEQIFKLMF